MKTIGKFVIILAIICIVSWGIATALFFSVYGDYAINNPKYYKQASSFEQTNATGIEKISINSASEDILVNVIERGNVTFNLTGYYNYGKYDNPPKLLLEKNGNEVIVRVFYEKPINLIGISSQDMKVYVNIPKNYSGDISVLSASGDVELNKINLNNLEATSASGNINLENIKVKNKAKINAVSGDINIISLSSKESRIESISGEINLEDARANRIDLSSVSGEINTINSENISSITTTSGEIEIENYSIKEDLNIESVSGEIELDLAEDSSIDLDFKSTSGDLENDFGKVYGGENKVNVKTNSGDLRVY